MSGHVRVDVCPKDPALFVRVRPRDLDERTFRRFREIVDAYGNYEGGAQIVRRDTTGALTAKLRGAGIAVWLAPVLQAEVAKEGVRP